jgi:hypothetical protein
MNTHSNQQPQIIYLYEQWNASETGMECLQIDTRKIEGLPQYFRPPWTKIDHNRFDYELCAIRRGASNERLQAETFCILNENYKKHSKIYTDGSKKDEKVEYARLCRSKD